MKSPEPMDVEDEQQHRNLPRVQLNAGEHSLHAWVARSEAEHDLGLMHRQELAHGEGMLFVFDVAGRWSFWM